MSKKYDITLISTADWDNPFWTNKQHVASQLSKLGNRVFYVDSLGLRKVTATSRDLSRIFRRLKRGLLPPRKINDNLYVWSPIIAPAHDNKYIRVLNRILLSSGLAFWRFVLGMKQNMLWTYSPVTSKLLDTKAYDETIYHLVDDIKEQPGMPREVLEEAEDELINKSDFVFVTSENLYRIHKDKNPNTHYFPNVADFDHFNKAMNVETKIPGDLLEIASPRLLLIGAISGYKVDFELLAEVAKERPEWSIILIGEVGEGDPYTNVDILKAHSNIHLLGPRPYSELPNYLKGADVAFLANRQNEYTKSMFPMKFFEYLAAGRNVVALELDALSAYSNVATFCKNKDEFIAGVEKCLSGNGPILEKRLEIAAQNTYTSRTEKMLNLLG